MTREDLERQTEELARLIGDTIEHWDDPDRVADRATYATKKEQR